LVWAEAGESAAKIASKHAINARGRRAGYMIGLR
jgi:hypothetical protein